MKNWSYILLISLVVLSCTQVGEQTQTPKDSLGIVMPSLPPKDTGWTNAKSDSPITDTKIHSTPSPPQKQETLKYIPDIGLKSFDERSRRQFDSTFKDWRKILRINDSLIAAKRRELQIEDSLKRLK
jgi:hypothetical protein